MTITDTDIGTIKEFALYAFKNRPDFTGLDNKEMQIYCIIDGLERFLSSKGVDCPFSLKGYVQQDSFSIDDPAVEEEEVPPKA